MDAFNTPDIDIIIHQPVRTRIMAFLNTRGEATFSELKSELQITDGNLDAHMRKLVAAGYIESHKQSGPGRPQTTYSLSKQGATAFEDYIETLKRLFSLDYSPPA